MGNKKVVYLDTETTGLRPGNITQISYIVTKDGVPSKVVNNYFKVDYIEQEASEITGLTPEKLLKLSNGKEFNELAEGIRQDLDGAIIVGHNIRFDMRFISEEMKHSECKEYNPERIVCTMEFMKDIMKMYKNKNEFKAPNLMEVLEFLEIPTDTVQRFARAMFKDSKSEITHHDSRFDSVAVYLISKKIERLGLGFI